MLAELQPQRIVQPQHMARHALEETLLPGRIYPTVYASRETFEGLALPRPYRRFVVLRDLRDTLISLYYSLRHSHAVLTPHIAGVRDELASLDVESGLLRLLDGPLRNIAAIQRSWANSSFFRYEDLLSEPESELQAIVEASEIPVDVRMAVRRHSFERVFGRKPGTEDVASHLRKGVAGDWRNHFDSRLKTAFKERFGDVLTLTGYEPSLDW